MKWFPKKKLQSLDLEEVLGDVYQKNFFQTENLEGSIKLSISKNSTYFIFVLFLFISTGFLWRAFSLQILQSENYKNKAINNSFSATPIPSVRGAILDRNGVVLAKTEKVTNQEVEGYQRKYIDSEGFGNLLGFVSYPEKDVNGRYWQDNFKGVEGLESYYDQLLSGKSGVALYEKSAQGKLSQSFISEPAINGKDIKISIDSDLQKFNYQKTKDFVERNNLSGGSGVVLDIQTGEVLSLVSYPTYNSNLLLPKIDSEFISASTSISRNEYLSNLNQDSKKPFLNRPIAGSYAPGSIVKPVFALAGLSSGIITPNTSIFSAGQIEVASQVSGGKPAIFRDWKAHGWTNVMEAIAVSSDVFFYSIVGGYQNQKGVGINVIDSFASAFGFDTESGIDLYGEAKGLIPTPDWKLKVFNESWRLGDTYNSAIGQYGFSMTPISAARMVGAVATNGNLITPKLLISESQTDGVQTQKVNLNISDKWYEVVQRGMRMTVTDGTAKVLNVNFVNVAAKTGTAEIGTSKKYVHSWITGYFPYENPKYAFVFVTEKAPREKAPSPALIAKDMLDWMNIYRSEYFGKEKVSTSNSDFNLENSTTSSYSAEIW